MNLDGPDMKKLIVCGDSYMSPRRNHKDKHFSEIFANTLGYELISYARGGMSNGGIALQILHAIKQSPDMIFFDITYSDRIEFPLESNKSIECDFSELNYNVNDVELSMTGSSGNLMSENLNTLLTKVYAQQYTAEKLYAVEVYFKELYSESWKNYTDRMMMYYVLHKLHLSNINYIFILDRLSIKSLHPLVDYFWLTEKNDLTAQLDPFFNRPMDEDDSKQQLYISAGFHTTYNTQKDIAEYIINHYNKYFA